MHCNWHSALDWKLPLQRNMAVFYMAIQYLLSDTWKRLTNSVSDCGWQSHSVDIKHKTEWDGQTENFMKMKETRFALGAWFAEKKVKDFAIFIAILQWHGVWA